jgi:hypothetical protein
MSSWTKARSDVAILSRAVKRGDKPADCPELADARRNFAAIQIANYIEKQLAAAPPLTEEQRCRLAELLRPARQAGGAVDV